MNHIATVGSGRYELLDLLGYGHFGEVWRCHDRELDEEGALKLFRSSVNFDHILAEAQLQNLSKGHPHVVTVRNVVLAAPRPFIVMEFLREGSVEGRLSAGRVSLVEAVRWTRNALDGLHHVHQRGVIHRDLKPANLLIRQNDTAALSDFGLAEDTIRAAIRDLYFPHAAPELINGMNSTVRSDIWAMGCTLYRLLAGRYPFDDPASTLAGQYEEPYRLNPQVPQSLSHVIRHALQVDPSNRYSDALAMVADLAACPVQLSWTQATVANAVEAWMAAGSGATYLVWIQAGKRGIGFEVHGTRDLGSGAGPRRFHRAVYPTLPLARQRMREILWRGVAAGELP